MFECSWCWGKKARGLSWSRHHLRAGIPTRVVVSRPPRIPGCCTSGLSSPPLEPLHWAAWCPQVMAAASPRASEPRERASKRERKPKPFLSWSWKAHTIPSAILLVTETTLEKWGWEGQEGVSTGREARWGPLESGASFSAWGEKKHTWVPAIWCRATVQGVGRPGARWAGGHLWPVSPGWLAGTLSMLQG